MAGVFATPFPLNLLGGPGASLGDLWLEEEPKAGLEYMLGQKGMQNRTNPFASWLRVMQPQLHNRFYGGLPERGFEDTWMQFLNRELPNLQTEFRQQSPGDRGERPQQFQGRVRYVGF